MAGKIGGKRIGAGRKPGPQPLQRLTVKLNAERSKMADALANPRQAIVRHVLPTQIVIRRSCGEVPGQAGKDPWP